ncbi:MAG: DUF2489 domain-containing protein [Gammaproteobacteria bacterium]|jgi:hypothetical protein|nr:DUF2489 domain-containing protein [Gammaproteobacteria bacterium]
MENIVLIALLSLFCLLMLKLVLFLWWRQRTRQKTNQQRIQNLQVMLQKQYEHRVDSIRVIANAMDSGQCEFTEGCIRLKHLIGQVEPQLLTQDKYTIINTIYTETEHIPIKEDWKKLNKKVQTKLSNERYALEAKYRSDIATAVKALRAHQFSTFDDSQ